MVTIVLRVNQYRAVKQTAPLFNTNTINWRPIILEMNALPGISAKSPFIFALLLVRKNGFTTPSVCQFALPTRRNF